MLFKYLHILVSIFKTLVQTINKTEFTQNLFFQVSKLHIKPTLMFGLNSYSQFLQVKYNIPFTPSGVRKLI